MMRSQTIFCAIFVKTGKDNYYHFPYNHLLFGDTLSRRGENTYILISFTPSYLDIVTSMKQVIENIKQTIAQKQILWAYPMSMLE